VRADCVVSIQGEQTVSTTAGPRHQKPHPHQPCPTRPETERAPTTKAITAWKIDCNQSNPASASEVDQSISPSSTILAPHHVKADKMAFSAPHQEL
jgi:hypothetical protein